ncbi:hypothetical protein [Algoriphagus sp. PAP.12]|jgi:hypothetical protein|nr:hypothetical protein [Algoriphagus sp. PAP.12]
MNKQEIKEPKLEWETIPVLSEREKKAAGTGKTTSFFRECLTTITGF